MTTKFIIVDNQEGCCYEAGSIESANGVLTNVIEELCYTYGTDAEGLVSVYEIKEEWDFESTGYRLTKPIKRDKRKA